MTLALLLVASAETRMTVVAGTAKGTATVVTRLLPDGAKYVRVDMSLRQPSGRKVTIAQESTYAPDGRPRHKSQTTTLPGGAEQAITVSFEPASVRYSARLGKETVVSQIPYPKTSFLATPEFWVVRDKPKAGRSVTYSRFDLAEHRWVATKCTYVGRRTVQLGGSRVSAHLIRMGDVTTYLDDKGDPVRLETPETVMERG